MFDLDWTWLILLPIFAGIFAIFCLIPAVFLRIAAQLITKITVPGNLSVGLTAICYLPIVGLLIAFREVGASWIFAVPGAVFALLVPTLVYGRLIKSDDGSGIGFPAGFLVWVVQQVAMVAIGIGIALAVQMLSHP